MVNQNDFDKALKTIDAQTSDYYVLGYYSSNPDPLRRTRKIEVKTSRDGVTVWSRTSYSLRPTPGPVQITNASINGGQSQRSMVTAGPRRSAEAA